MGVTACFSGNAPTVCEASQRTKFFFLFLGAVINSGKQSEQLAAAKCQAVEKRHTGRKYLACSVEWHRQTDRTRQQREEQAYFWRRRKRSASRGFGRGASAVFLLRGNGTGRPSRICGSEVFGPFFFSGKGEIFDPFIFIPCHRPTLVAVKTYGIVANPREKNKTNTNGTDRFCSLKDNG